MDARAESPLGIANRIREISRDGLDASLGSLYPALHRLELRGDVTSQTIPSPAPLSFQTVGTPVLEGPGFTPTAPGPR